MAVTVLACTQSDKRIYCRNRELKSILLSCNQQLAFFALVNIWLCVAKTSQSLNLEWGFKISLFLSITLTSRYSKGSDPGKFSRYWSSSLKLTIEHRLEIYSSSKPKIKQPCFTSHAWKVSSSEWTFKRGFNWAEERTFYILIRIPRYLTYLSCACFCKPAPVVDWHSSSSNIY